MDACGIGEHGDFRFGGKPVALGEGVSDNGWEFGVQGGFAVTGEGDGVYLYTFVFLKAEHPFQIVFHFLGGRKDGVVSPVSIPTTFTIDAVEIANLALFG